MKKTIILFLSTFSLLALVACSQAKAKPKNITLTGTFYAEKSQGKAATFEFEKAGGTNYIYYTYYTKTNATGAYSMNMLSLDYRISGEKITLKWGNKADKDFGFKPHDVVGIGKISKDHRTITITKDNTEEKGNGWLYDSYSKDNKNAQAAESGSSSSADAENQWKKEVQTYIDQNIKTDEDAKLSWSGADYNAFVADDIYDTTAGKNGAVITDVLAKYPTPNDASVGFDKNELILDYGDITGNHFVQLTFTKLDDGSYHLTSKSEKGL